ncbi:hypothetical protein CRM22_011155 [Opisthorchis felineus]|uniref:Uncharacterized protein n=1 Tax=Opisthorchis felineus TaxID=147828 RepID=A0A4S2KAD8_OPIFE|nr:hypothetical protein CRM22_011155 [Opisthorchis felineus]
MIVLQLARNRTTRYETFVANRPASTLDYSEPEDLISNFLLFFALYGAE